MRPKITITATIPGQEPFSHHVHPGVLRLAIEMQAKIDRDEHKGDWAGNDHVSLFADMIEEMVELMNASAADAWQEAADVANYAMMIADKKTRDVNADA